MLNFIIQSDNYDIFHAVEPKLKNYLQSLGIQFAIISWNSDLINYVIDNYGCAFLLEYEDYEEEENENGEIGEKNKNGEKGEIGDKNKNGEIDDKNGEIGDKNKNGENSDKNGENSDENKNGEIGDKNGENSDKNKSGENDENGEIGDKNKNAKTTKKSLIDGDFFGLVEEKIIDMIEHTIYSYNFSFFKSFLLPILKSNPIIISGNYQSIITSTINDSSFYFPNEFIQFPVYANFLYTEKVNSILVKAIEKNLVQAVEYLIQFPLVDINGMIFYACGHFSCIQIIKILSSHPSFDVNFKNSVNHIDVFKLSLINGNFYAAMFFTENFPDLEIEESFYDVYYFIKNNHLMSLKIYIKLLMDKNDDEKFQKIIDGYKEGFALNHLDDSFEKKLLDTVNELINK